jgi:hypothetical protein
LPNGFPEDGTDSKSESFGGLVFAMYFPPHITNAEIIPRDSRQGLTPTTNTFPMFNHFQSFKKYKNSISQFFQRQLHRLCPDTIVFCVLTRRAGFPVIQR